MSKHVDDDRGDAVMWRKLRERSRDVGREKETHSFFIWLNTDQFQLNCSSFLMNLHSIKWIISYWQFKYPNIVRRGSKWLTRDFSCSCKILENTWLRLRFHQSLDAKSALDRFGHCIRPKYTPQWEPLFLSFDGYFFRIAFCCALKKNSLFMKKKSKVFRTLGW